MSPSPAFRHPPHPRRSLSRGFLAVFAFLLCGAGGTQPPAEPALQEGLTLEREIRGGETHVYPVELQDGQFLRVVAQEDGIDLAVRLIGPDGKVATGVDTYGFGFDCQEDLAAVAESSGLHRVEVEAAEAPAGSYKLTVPSVRLVAGDRDQIRAEAVRARWEAFHPPGEAGVEQRIRSLEHALELWRRLEERPEQAEVLFHLGNTRLTIKDFRQSALLWQDLEDPWARLKQIKTLNSAGNALKRVRRIDEAKQLFEQAAGVARDIQNLEQEAISLSNLGLLEADEGEPQKAIITLLLAQERAQKAGTLKPKLFNNLAFAYEQIGDRHRALQNYQKSLELARRLGSKEDEAAALNNIGDTCYILGDWEQALSYLQRALELNRAIKDHAREAKSLVNIGAALQRLGRFDEAHSTFDQALQLSGEDLETRTKTLIQKAYLLGRQKRPAEALELARKALPYTKDWWTAEADVRQILGMAHRTMGNLSEARTELERAVGLARSRRESYLEASYSLSLAHVDRDAKDLTTALSRVGSAIETIESVRARVVNPELRAMLLASKQDYYEFQIDTLMSLHAKHPTQGFAAAALEASERARARSLLEILQESDADIREGADPALAEKERRLREEVNAREWRRLTLSARQGPGGEAIKEAERRVEEAREELRKLQDELLASSPRYAALTQPRPLTLAEIQRQILDGRALLLEYKLGAERSFLWAVSPDSIESFELPGKEVIDQTARRWYELLTARNQSPPGEKTPDRKARIQQADGAAEQVARELSKMLLGPVENRLGNRPLLIVADGALQYVPFAALRTPSSGTLLVEGHEVVNLPSASTLAVLRRELGDRQRASKLVALLADPVFQKHDERLTKPSVPKQSGGLATVASTRGAWSPDSREPGIDLSSLRRLASSEKEARTIASFVAPDQILLMTGLKATRAVATSPELARYQNVHFATHGVLDSRRPELSGLIFSLYDEKGKEQDGILRLNDIYNLHLEADLVVLSACRTALGKEIRGEGLVGLTRGFMYAGAARVLASLWSVEDRATAELMGDLYRGMLREELSPAAALRKAQLEMAKTPHWQSPYYWAGFSLQGEWR